MFKQFVKSTGIFCFKSLILLACVAVLSEMEGVDPWFVVTLALASMVYIFFEYVGELI